MVYRRIHSTIVLLVHPWGVYHILAECGAAIGGGSSCGSKSASDSILFRRDLADLRDELSTYDHNEAYADDSMTWYKLVSKDIASNIRLLDRRHDETASIPIFKKRAVEDPVDEFKPHAVLCRNGTADCDGTFEDMWTELGLSESEDDDASSVTTTEVGGDEEEELERVMILSAAAYIETNDIILKNAALADELIDEYPISYTHVFRTLGGNEPTLFRIWRFKDDESTLYVSFLGIVDKSVYFSGLDTELAPLSLSPLVPSSPKRSHAEVADSIPHVHKGFLLQYLAIEEHIHDLIAQSISGTGQVDRIVFTGHSIGGAIATIAGVLARYVYSDLTLEVITFGSPRVGDILFAEQFARTVTSSLRVVRESDIIPIVYPIAASFHHVTDSMCIDCATIPSREISPYSRMKLAVNSIGRSLIRHHEVARYLKSIQDLQQSDMED